jgi:hypothetical protein
MMFMGANITDIINRYEKIHNNYNKSDDTKKRVEIIKKRLMVLMDMVDSKKEVLDEGGYLTIMDSFKRWYEVVENITNDNIDKNEKYFKENIETQVMEIIKIMNE